jgi:hypothetical protein
MRYDRHAHMHEGSSMTFVSNVCCPPTEQVLNKTFRPLAGCVATRAGEMNPVRGVLSVLTCLIEDLADLDLGGDGVRGSIVRGMLTVSIPRPCSVAASLTRGLPCSLGNVSTTRCAGLTRPASIAINDRTVASPSARRAACRPSTGHESTDGLCFGASRTVAHARPGGHRSSSRLG